MGMGMTTTQDIEIAFLEELAANAVPPAIALELDGWRLRANAGVTRRANSVLAARMGDRHDLDTRLDLVEQFYARHVGVARFQLCPASRPTDLEERLAARGYVVGSPPTHVQVGPIAAMAAMATGRSTIMGRSSDEWLMAYIEGEGETNLAKIAARQLMLDRIGPPAGFAALREGDAIAAVALGVVERGWLGIFSVATRPAYRRRGLANLALGDLAAWARGLGARNAYLQVLSTNTPALALYARLGFTTRYDYWYRERALI